MGPFTGEIAALAAAFLWAIATVVYGSVGRRIPPRELNLVKGSLALAMLLATLLLTASPSPFSEPRALVLLMLSGVIGIGLGDTVYFKALQQIGARRTLLLGILAPPMAALVAVVFLGETLSLGGWLGIVVTVLGVAWVITERTPGREPSRVIGSEQKMRRGIAFGLAAAVAQAIGAVLAHAALSESSITPLWGAFLRLAAGLLMLVVWIAAARQPVGRWLREGQSGKVWGRLLFAVFAGTYLAIWLQQVALKLTSAGVAQTLLATSPLFVLPLAAWTGEKVTLRAAIGAAIALAGIAVLFGVAG
jgi:drug/metabolite transporter (DMT)-like permease